MISEKTGGAESFSYGRLTQQLLGCQEVRLEHLLDATQLAFHVASSMHAETHVTDLHAVGMSCRRRHGRAPRGLECMTKDLTAQSALWHDRPHHWCTFRCVEVLFQPDSLAAESTTLPSRPT